MSIKVKWIPVDRKNVKNAEVNITHFAPEPAFKYFKNNRQDSAYLKCPAFVRSLKNTFILRSPYHMVLKADANLKTLSVLNQSQEFFNCHLSIFNIINNVDPIMITMPPRYIFITDSKIPVQITMLPMILTPNAQFGVITGSFDITKWVRLVECAIEIYEPSKALEINIGDPLCMVSFAPANDDTVILEQDVCTAELVELAMACVMVKESIKGLNLNALYTMASGYINLMFNKIFKKEQ